MRHAAFPQPVTIARTTWQLQDVPQSSLLPMTLEGTTAQIVALAQQSHSTALAIAFLLAFTESVALLSLFVPATFILVAFAGVLGAGGISFWAAWLAASLGAALGYAASFWLGLLFKEKIHNLWPFSRNPALLERSRAFIARYGLLAVFLGHFFGPARAGVPVVAGVLSMPHASFQAANIAASFVWAAVVLAPGQIGLPWLLGK